MRESLDGGPDIADYATRGKLLADPVTRSAVEAWLNPGAFAELKKKNGKAVWEIEVLADSGKVVEVDVDADTGDVVDSETQKK